MAISDVTAPARSHHVMDPRCSRMALRTSRTNNPTQTSAGRVRSSPFGGELKVVVVCLREEVPELVTLIEERGGPIGVEPRPREWKRSNDAPCVGPGATPVVEPQSPEPNRLARISGPAHPTTRDASTTAHRSRQRRARLSSAWMMNRPLPSAKNERSDPDRDIVIISESAMTTAAAAIRMSRLASVTRTTAPCIASQV